MDDKNSNLQKASEEVKSCQESKELKSCLECEKTLECDTRKKYVQEVYKSMSSGDGGFEF